MKKILIIDDEEQFCYITKLNLEDTGDFEIHICTDSADAIRQAKQLQPDLILLDIVMPGISGTDIAQELKNGEDTQKIPIVFLTGLITKEEAENRQHFTGGDYIVSKPIETNQLINIIDRLTS